MELICEAALTGDALVYVGIFFMEVYFNYMAAIVTFPNVLDTELARIYIGDMNCTPFVIVY